MSPEYLAPLQVTQMLNSNDAVVIDVRELVEYHESHIEGAIHIPLSEIRQNVDLLSNLDQDVIVMVCRVGRRSHIACEMSLEEQVPKKIYNMQGGMNAWIDEGLPVIKGR